MRPRLIAVIVAVAGILVAQPAAASLGLSTGTPVVFGSLAPGTTATASGTLTATSTNLTWTLTAQDTATQTPGRMDKLLSDASCATGDASLTTPLALRVTGSGTSTGFVELGAAPQLVASGSGLLVAALLTTTYRQAVPATQRMAAGCSYQLTTTFTIS